MKKHGKYLKITEKSLNKQRKSMKVDKIGMKLLSFAVMVSQMPLMMKRSKRAVATVSRATLLLSRVLKGSNMCTAVVFWWLGGRVH